MTDYEKIISLVNFERQARVRHLFDKLKDCYFADATVTTSWTSGKANNYLNGSEGRNTDSEHPIVNRAGNPIVHQNKTRAYVELPSTTIRWYDLNGTDIILESYMRLIYSVECRDGVWKIVDMESINEADAIRPVVPGKKIEIDEEKLKTFRHSYRYLAYLRSLKGIKVSDNLYGIDRPDEANKFYENRENWIHEID